MKTLENTQNIIKRLAFFIFILLIWTGCSKDFLERKPDNRTLITTLDEMDKTVRDLNPRADALFTEIFTGDYVFKSLPSHAVANMRDQFTAFYTFRCMREHLRRSDYPVRGGNVFNPNRAWVRYYYRIQNTSLIISKLDKIVPGDDDEKKLYNSILGRALAIKAYCNFMLVNLFAKDYDPATADKDPGIPFILEYTGKSIETYPVASVKKVYDNIEQNSLKALTLLDDNLLDNKKYNFTTISVQALLSEVYLFKHNWAKAVEYADKVIAKNSSVLDVRSLKSKYETKFDEYGKQYFNSDNESYLLASDNTRQYISYYWSSFYPYPLQQFMDNNGRSRESDFIQTSPLFSDKVPIKTIYFSNNPAGRFFITIPLLSVDKTYYNRAEANIELGNLDKAKADIRLMLGKDNYQNNRWQNRLNSINNKDALMKYLLDSKRMRFFGEGVRWFDIKRHHLRVENNYLGKNYVIDGTKPEDYAIKYPSEETE